MNFKKRIVTTLCAAVLAAVCAAGVDAWDVYDTDYGDEYHEGSITYIDDDTEVLRENDNLEDDWALLYTVRPDGTAVIVSYAGKFMEGAKFEFNIPSEINGHTVVAIGDRALRDGYAHIVGLTLPSTIKEIGVNAIDCRYLKYLKLNDGLEVIKNAGINCGDLLDTLVIPESVKYIGSGGVSGEALKNITLPKNLEFLGENILLGSAYVADAANRENEILYHGEYLLAGLQIGYAAIENPDPGAPTENRQIHVWEATGDIAIREGTTKMCEDAFGMSNITSVKLPSTLKDIPHLGFYWCKNLNHVVIPGNVKEIGDNAFSWCESLTDLTISEGVERIGEAAFFRCNNLNEVTIPQSVTQIDLHAFGWDYVNDYDVRNENLVIKCYSGTAAEQYARDNGFECHLLDTGEVIPKGDPTAAADGRATCEKGEKCAVKRFKDIEDALGDENHTGIEFCLAHGIMNGTGDTTFEPDNTITRAQFATMFYRLAGSPEAPEAGKFTDLTEDWYKKAVNWAASNGIVNGTGDTTFSPNETITREQIATIFYRYAQTKGLDMTVEDSWDLSKSTYRDNIEIADYALTPMNWCFNHHIMFIYIDKSHGYEGLIAPKVAPTRAETAALFWQFGILLGL